MNLIRTFDRKQSNFKYDILKNNKKINKILKKSKILVLGGAGSIGQAVTKELFSRNTKHIDVVDISENNLVELVRDIRSSNYKSLTNLNTFAIDIGGIEFEIFIKKKKYDYIFNLSALKHVRSEKDPYTLHRMTIVNIFNTIKILKLCNKKKLKKYFCVSTDKASDPANMMGASKRIMELMLLNKKQRIKISMARFANVLFSDGSLLHGFRQRFLKSQPLSAPIDISRYFITSSEAAELCLLSCILGKDKEVYFPKENKKMKLINFAEIAKAFIKKNGYTPVIFNTEKKAILKNKTLIKNRKWALHLFKSDTTGEKVKEDFFNKEDKIFNNKYKSIGIIKNKDYINPKKINLFYSKFNNLKFRKKITKNNIVDIYKIILPLFRHLEKNKYLDQRM